jgi:CRP-like cAMP-binding protein
MPATELRTAIQTSLSLRESLLKFVQAFGVQTTHTAICNAQSRLDVRLARWLLMAHDRIGNDTLPLTHEFLSLMLGVRRPGVTETLHALRKQGLISYGRGQITVKDREGMERAADEAYGTPEVEYRRLIGGKRRRVGG